MTPPEHVLQVHTLQQIASPLDVALYVH